ncbi:nucleotidyltransferase [Parapedobacter sp. ISTM3]|uniref:nucleotidyltransferase n=1 Tax=Parapedobacter sp. ISTM3 TaxID=2800130 RepID=UPI0019043839|nr:nucleotidyltransferase [Parapedobacter sp. ISTM3]MBK1442569.1 nucleotidyltransferase [Parapedobacter sp. ISTM3]
MIFEQDFTDFVQLLNNHQVKYMVVGAYALSFHGRPRHTGDLDIWIKPDAENAGKMVKVIDEFGFGKLGLTEEDFLRENYVTQLGYPPLRIDILNAISGVDFDEAYHTRLETEIDGLDISFISANDLIRNKRNVGRPKDIGDIEALEKLKKQQEDEPAQRKRGLRR